MKFIDVGEGISINLEAITMIKRTNTRLGLELMITFGSVQKVNLTGYDANRINAILEEECGIPHIDPESRK